MRFQLPYKNIQMFMNTFVSKYVHVKRIVFDPSATKVNHLDSKLQLVVILVALSQKYYKHYHSFVQIFIQSLTNFSYFGPFLFAIFRVKYLDMLNTLLSMQYPENISSRFSSKSEAHTILRKSGKCFLITVSILNKWL